MPWTAEEIHPRIRKTRTANILSGSTEILAAPISHEIRHIVYIRAVGELSGIGQQVWIGTRESGGSTDTWIEEGNVPQPKGTAGDKLFGDDSDYTKEIWPLQAGQSLRARTDTSGNVSCVVGWWPEGY